MKIECIKDKLLEGVQKVEKATGKNTTLPILSCILLIAKNNTLTLKATNLEIGVEVEIGVKVLQEGVVAVPGSLFLQILATLKAFKTITLEEEGGVLHIKNEEVTSTLKIQPYEEFPLIPKIEEESFYTLKTKDFISGVKGVVQSASLSSIKPELGSVYIYQNTNHLTFVATDSFRLAEKKVVIKTSKEIPSLLIPYKNILEIVRILENTEDEIMVKTTKNQISVATKTIYITSRIIDGVFPDYNQIIPKEFETTFTTLKQDIIDAIRSVSVFSDKFNQITFTIENNTALFENKNADIGEGRSRIKIKQEGKSLVIKFNQKYITDAFPSIPDETILFSFAGPHKALLIEGGSNKSFRYLVMPMNT